MTDSDLVIFIIELSAQEDKLLKFGKRGDINANIFLLWKANKNVGDMEILQQVLVLGQENLYIIYGEIDDPHE